MSDVDRDVDRDIGRDVDQGLRRLDDYLYWQAELAGAREEAAAFCDQLPWLTTGERHDVETRYTRARAALAEETTRHIAARAGQLRAEYERRYLRLRRRALMTAIAAVTVGWAVALGVVVLRVG